MKIKIAEFRTLPTDGKALEEQRTELVNEMTDIVESAKAETRTLTDEEETRYDEIKKEISKIDKTLSAIDEQRAFNKIPAKKNAEEEGSRIRRKSICKLYKRSC